MGLIGRDGKRRNGWVFVKDARDLKAVLEDVTDVIGRVDMATQRGISAAIDHSLHQVQRVVDFDKPRAGVALLEHGALRRIANKCDSLRFKALDAGLRRVIDAGNEHARADQVGPCVAHLFGPFSAVTQCADHQCVALAQTVDHGLGRLGLPGMKMQPGP